MAGCISYLEGSSLFLWPEGLKEHKNRWNNKKYLHIGMSEICYHKTASHTNSVCLHWDYTKQGNARLSFRRLFRKKTTIFSRKANVSDSKPYTKWTHRTYITLKLDDWKAGKVIFLLAQVWTKTSRDSNKMSREYSKWNCVCIGLPKNFNAITST